MLSAVIGVRLGCSGNTEEGHPSASSERARGGKAEGHGRLSGNHWRFWHGKVSQEDLHFRKMIGGESRDMQAGISLEDHLLLMWTSYGLDEGTSSGSEDQRPETFCNGLIKLSYQLNAQGKEEESRNASWVPGVGFWVDTVLNTINSAMAFRMSDRLEKKERRCWVLLGELVLVLHPSVHSNRIYGSGERSNLSPVYEYRYGAFSVQFISGGEGVDSDNRVTNTEPLNTPAL